MCGTPAPRLGQGCPCQISVNASETLIPGRKHALLTQHQQLVLPRFVTEKVPIPHNTLDPSSLVTAPCAFAQIKMCSLSPADISMTVYDCRYILHKLTFPAQSGKGRKRRRDSGLINVSEWKAFPGSFSLLTVLSRKANVILAHNLTHR